MTSERRAPFTGPSRIPIAGHGSPVVPVVDAPASAPRGRQSAASFRRSEPGCRPAWSCTASQPPDATVEPIWLDAASSARPDTDARPLSGLRRGPGLLVAWPTCSGFGGLAKARAHWHAPTGDRRTKDQRTTAERAYNRCQAGLRAAAGRPLGRLRPSASAARRYDLDAGVCRAGWYSRRARASAERGWVQGPGRAEADLGSRAHRHVQFRVAILGRLTAPILELFGWVARHSDRYLKHYPDGYPRHPCSWEPGRWPFILVRTFAT